MIQGITDNLKGGAPGTVGKNILHGVSRGQFVLRRADSTADTDHLDARRVSTRRLNRTSAAAPVNLPQSENQLRDAIVALLKPRAKRRRIARSAFLATAARREIEGT